MRARTRPGRLKWVDRWLVHERPEILAGAARLIDVGFGESPVTVYELAESVRAISPLATVHGVEAEPSRVPPRPWPDGVSFSAGPVVGPASVVRAMNVLRGHGEAHAAALQAEFGAALCEGGLLLEGSSDTDGHLLTCHLKRRANAILRSEGVLFFSDFARGFSPWQFRDWLPRDLRRDVKPGTDAHAFLSGWNEVVEASGARTPAARFEAGLNAPGVAATNWEREHGFVCWQSGTLGE